VDASDSERKKSPVEGRSANHFEVAFTEFEFLLDFGQAYDTSTEALWHTRIIMTPSSAKTLTRMLQHMLTQYESDLAPIPERTN
jgi:hypothetical protein